MKVWCSKIFSINPEMHWYLIYGFIGTAHSTESKFFLWKPVGRNHFKLVPPLKKGKINWCHHSTHRKSIDWAWKKWRGNPIKFHTEIIQPQLLKKQLSAKLLKHPICQKIAYTALEQKQNSYVAKPQFVSWLKVVG